MNRNAPAVALAYTIGVQIVYPLTHGSVRDVVCIVVVVASATAGLTHAIVSSGHATALRYALTVGGIGYAAEVLGTATGFPFGCYSYSPDRLGPLLFDVPLLIPLAWIGGVYPVWIVARLLVRSRVLRIAAVAVGVTSWDLYLDPQMVVEGYWTWCPGQVVVPGMGTIPFTNYAGWLGVALVMAVALEFVTDATAEPEMPMIPVIAYLWTWIGSATAHLVFLDPSLRKTAAYGFVGMAILGIPAAMWTRTRLFPATRASADDLRR
ncbi:MAG: carotenoid biosynthesis protein [Nocardiaceae bacterium]|nr:carotenoid biosynthesis protein [Nocardiaceae bacterium]